jgi:sulfur-oxidizing protein SoxX
MFCAMLFVYAGLASSADTLQQRVDAVLRRSFSEATPEEWKTRLDQDEAQAACSHYRDAPPVEVAAAMMAQAKAAIRYPESGQLIGDWASGERLAKISGGGQLSRIEPDPAGAQRGGNCFACHALTRSEIAAGTLGPSLIGYAKLRGTSVESVRYTYEKLYNAQAFSACSFMPRFGHNGWLTPKQLADIVAFLLDPQSPVNR